MRAGDDEGGVGGRGGGVTWRASFSASRDVCSSAHRPSALRGTEGALQLPHLPAQLAASAAPSFPAAAAAAAAVAIAN